MCIYCGTKKYRKIYELHSGFIPKDEDGRTFDIHHIDGNHNNNSPENLKAVSIKEHYDIHYARGDYNACHRLSKRAKMTPEEISYVGTLAQKKRVSEGTHNFLGPENNRRKIENGTHPFVGPHLNRRKLEEGTHTFLQPDFIEENRARSRQRCLKMVAEGTHIFVTNNPAKTLVKKRVEDGKHHFVTNNPAKVQWTCSHCNVSGKGKSNFTRHHGNNCKSIRCEPLDREVG